MTALFDKYIQNNVRSLRREEAVKMLMTEFALDDEQAQNMFETFDKDKNGIMSIWEFQQFYMCAGTWLVGEGGMEREGGGGREVERERGCVLDR